MIEADMQEESMYSIWYCTESRGHARRYAIAPTQETNCRVSHLELLIFQLALQFLRFRYLSYCFIEIILVDCISVILDGEQATEHSLAVELDSGILKDLRFRHNVPQIGPIQTVTHLYHTLEIDVTLRDHPSCMDLHDLQTANLVWERNLNLSVKTSSTQEGRVEGIRSIRSHDDLCLAKIIEAVKLIQELHQSSLNLTIC
jgi:hypothetical protein